MAGDSVRRLIDNSAEKKAGADFTFQMTFTGHKKHMSSGDRNVKVLVIDYYEKRLNAFDQTG